MNEFYIDTPDKFIKKKKSICYHSQIKFFLLLNLICFQLIEKCIKYVL